MQCPSCKYQKSRLVKITHNDDDTMVNRRRECLRCGLRYNTQETMKEYKRKGERK